MDLYTKVNMKIDTVIANFTTQMAKYERQLKESATMSMSSDPMDISTLASDFSEFKVFTWNCLDALRSQAELLLLGQDRLEQASRRKVLLLHGVPEVAGEVAETVVKCVLTDKMKLSPECASDIQVAHRLGSKIKESDPRPLLVRFNMFSSRSEAWNGKTSLKGTGITMSEFLTKARHQVFMAARKHFGMRNCWSTEGRITLLLPDKSRQKIESMKELQVHTDKFPSSAAQSGTAGIPASKSTAPAAAEAPAPTAKRNRGGRGGPAAEAKKK